DHQHRAIAGGARRVTEHEHRALAQRRVVVDRPRDLARRGARIGGLEVAPTVVDPGDVALDLDLAAEHAVTAHTQLAGAAHTGRRRRQIERRDRRHGDLRRMFDDLEPRWRKIVALELALSVGGTRRDHANLRSTLRTTCVSHTSRTERRGYYNAYCA